MNTHRKKLLFVLVTLMIALAIGVFMTTEDAATENVTVVQSTWFESSSTGKLTQDMSYFAVSARIGSELRMSYPYNQLTASIGFGCDQSEHWMYLAFSEPPNFANAETEEEVNRFSAKIRFDEKTFEFDATQAFGSRFVHFKEDNLILTRLLQSSAISVEVDWHREGFVNFEFPLAGSANVIESATAKCSGI